MSLSRHRLLCSCLRASDRTIIETICCGTFAPHNQDLVKHKARQYSACLVDLPYNCSNIVLFKKDRVVSHALPYRYGKWKFVVGIMGGWLLCGTSLAAQLTIPNTFTPDTPAKADQVNANFAAAANAVNTSDQQLTNLLNSPAGGVVVKVGSLTIGPLVDGSSFEAIDVLSATGFVVQLSTGTTTGEPFGVIPTIPVEGSLNPRRILFTEPNCTGTPFINIDPFSARQGLVIGNPTNAQVGYYGRGEASLMPAQSILISRRPLFGSVTPGFCNNGESIQLEGGGSVGFFDPGTVLGIPLQENDPQITGVPNNLSGPINFTLAR